MSVKIFNKEENKWVILPGTIGAPGKDAYIIAQENGYQGTKEEYGKILAGMPDVIEKIKELEDSIPTDYLTIQIVDTLPETGTENVIYVTSDENENINISIWDKGTFKTSCSSKDIDTKISEHNNNNSSHNDIRELIKKTTTLPTYDSINNSLTFNTQGGDSLEVNLGAGSSGIQTFTITDFKNVKTPELYTLPTGTIFNVRVDNSTVENAPFTGSSFSTGTGYVVLNTNPGEDSTALTINWLLQSSDYSGIYIGTSTAVTTSVVGVTWNNTKVNDVVTISDFKDTSWTDGRKAGDFVFIQSSDQGIPNGPTDSSKQDAYAGYAQIITLSEDGTKLIKLFIQSYSGPAEDNKIFSGSLVVAGGETVLEWKEIGGLEPDNEDIVSVENSEGNSVLKLADRAYNPTEFSGKGYKILRKNIVDGKNVLTQEMVNDANTVYEIRYDFDLNRDTINIPEGCVIKFKGGSLINGSINGNNTFIYGDLDSIFNNTILIGTYKNLECNLIWWGVQTSAEVDNSSKIQNAFDSSIFIINVSSRYYISKPISLPYNKVIKGRTGNNNKLTGFYANDDFTSVIIDFPERQGKEAFSQEVFGMFYHRDTTKLEMHDIFIDARYKSDFCIEHIDLYGSVDLYNCYLGNAREVGLLQYGCENPIINQAYITGCNIGVYISSKKYINDDIFGKDSETIGQPNIAHFTSLRCLGNNYGLLILGGSNYALNDLETAGNSILGLYIRNTTANINNYYIERDGICNFWIDSDGTKTETGSNGQALQYLIDNNLDGFPSFRADIEYGQIVYYRAPIIIDSSNVLFNSAYWSYKSRSSQNNNVTEVAPPTERTYGGIDSFILVLRPSYIQGKNITPYGWSNGEGKAPDYAVIELPKTIDSYLSKIDLQFNRVTNYLQIKAVPTTVLGYKNEVYKLGKTFRDNRNFYYSLNRQNFVDYNTNQRLYGPYSSIRMEENQFVEYYNNIPLFKISEENKVSRANRTIIFTKEQFNQLVGTRRQLKLLCVVKYLVDITDRFNIDCRFTNSGTYVTGNALDSSSEKLIENGIYIYEILIDTNIGNLEFDKYQISFNLNHLENFNNILISDIFLYDVDDNSQYIPDRPLYLQQGTFSKKPINPPISRSYFCTDRQTTEGTTNGIMIYYKGEGVWVDALGRVIE